MQGSYTATSRQVFEILDYIFDVVKGLKSTDLHVVESDSIINPDGYILVILDRYRKISITNVRNCPDALKFAIVGNNRASIVTGDLSADKLREMALFDFELTRYPDIFLSILRKFKSAVAVQAKKRQAMNRKFCFNLSDFLLSTNDE